LGVVLAGTLADVDMLTELIGPGAYLSGRRTYTHSIFVTVLVIAIAVGVALVLRGKTGPPQKPGLATDGGIAALLAAATLGAVVHVLMDLATSNGLELLWPMRGSRFAWDWLPGMDLWILLLLLVGILLPELFGLVGSEIGAKSKTPRGRNGAIAALALMVIYVVARATLHGNAVAQLDAHTYRGESPRRLAAFADSLSVMTWHGVVETETEICTVSVPATDGARFDPEIAVCIHKPEGSPALAAAQQTESVRRFLQARRFPKASVGATEDGTEVVVRDFRDIAVEDTRYALAARVLLDRSGRVTSQDIVWASKVRLR
jgi:inner membrane protein